MGKYQLFWAVLTLYMGSVVLLGCAGLTIVLNKIYGVLERRRK